MVNFRFHLVSLIAVFLALGLGILTGSAVVNQATVQTIRREIRDVRAEVNSLRSTNGQLKDDLNRANAFLADSAAYAVDGRLIDVPVAVLAERGVSGDDVNDTIALVRAAGAVAPAIVWLESKWTLGNDSDVQSLRNATDLDGGANSVRQRALDELALRLTSPPVGAVPGEAPVPDLLKRLSDAGFISIDPGNADMTTFPPTPARALLVTGTQSDFAGTDMTVDTAQALVNANAPTVVGEVYVQQDGGDAPKRGDAVAKVRAKDTLAAVVSTVDDLELVQGRVAAVLALQQLGAGTVGHYGYGDGASSSLPPSQPNS